MKIRCGLGVTLSICLLCQQANAGNTFDINAPGATLELPWFDGNSSERLDPQTLNQILRSTPTFPWQFKQAQVTVFQVNDGLIWLARDDAILAHDWQIELSGVTTLTLPDIGWQRIKAPIKTVADCQAIDLKEAELAACSDWFAAQQTHQRNIADMFRQRIVISAGTLLPTPPALWSEAALQHGFNWLATPDPSHLYVSETNHQHWLQLFIPWSAFPPFDRQSLTQVYLKTKRCSKNGTCSGGKLQGFAMNEMQSAVLILSKSLKIQLGSCAAELPTWPDDATFYMKLRGAKQHGQSWTLSSVFTFINAGGGYLDRPDNSRSSPEILLSYYVDSELSPNVTLCQPQMVLNIDDQIVPGTVLDFVEGEGNRAPKNSDSELHNIGSTSDRDQSDPTPTFIPAHGNDYVELEIRPLSADRWLLLELFHLIPPDSGEGANGACDTASFSVWIADAKQGHLRQALALGGYGPDLCAGHGVLYAYLSADGRFVHTASGDDNGAETSESYCFDTRNDGFFVCERAVRAANLSETN